MRSETGPERAGGGQWSARVRPLPLRGVLRLGRSSDIWHKPALSVAVATAIPSLVLLAAGRLDLALYASGGSLCALYAHGQPYAVRARTLLWVVLGMTAGVAAGLCTAAATDSTALRVLVAALLAGAHKVVCDAARIGPPGNLIFTFIAASSAFLPQRAADIPAHLALVLLGGAVAWLVCMAPALVRPDGPQRIAVARALEAAARQAADPGPAARHAAAAAVNAAWHTLFQVGARTPGRAGLELLVVRAESVMAGGQAGGAVDGDADPARLADWARRLRRGGAPPVPEPRPAEAGELRGVAADRRAADARHHRRPWPHAPRGARALLAGMGPGSPLLPIGARVALGGAAAGWASMLLGVGRPYWAVVTAAAIFQANTTLTWGRALQRGLGNLLGTVLFTALLPVTRLGALALLATVLACQIAAEATMARNYWLGSVFVTPMALAMVEFAGYQPARTLVAERLLDTCLGIAAGLLSCALVTNRRATGRIGAALDRLAAATGDAEDLARQGADADPLEAAWARDRLANALADLREAADVAAGEWWQRALPEDRVERAEREGHRVLAEPPLAPAYDLARPVSSGGGGGT
ncbi:FUSC family protein [Spirillospora sp. NPDC050679]